MANLLNNYFIYIVILLFGIFAGFSIFVYFNKNRNKYSSSDSVTCGLTECEFDKRTSALISGKSDTVTFVSMQFENWIQSVNAYGNGVTTAALRHLNNVLSGQLSQSELFVRTGEDSFSFIIKNRKMEEVCARLDRIYDSAKEYTVGEADGFQIQLVFGIYQPIGCSETIADMKDKAVSARVNINNTQRYRFYDSSMDENGKIIFAGAEAIENALKYHEFVVYLQPKVRTFDKKIIGAEALVRWRHFQKGLLSPDMFFQYVKKYYKESKIDLFVVDSVCDALSRWVKEDRETCPISINISSQSFKRSDFPEICQKICAGYGVDPSLIEFEFKEEILINDLQYANDMFYRFHDYGFRCAVDNFGTSYTSLSLLSALDIDTIKLDCSFFSGENDNRKGRYIVESILKLATQLHISSVAEGIEKAGQASYLQKAACEAIQGYFYFKPMPVSSFEEQAYANMLLGFAPDTAVNVSENVKTVPETDIVTSKSIVMFTYLSDEDVVEFSDVFSPVLNNRRRYDKALSLFRTTDLVHENDRSDFLELIERSKREDGWVENTLRFYVNGNRYCWLELHLRNEGNVISGTMINTAQWKNEVDRWKEKATRDALTGLYNREYFEHTSHLQLRQKNFTTAAMLFIDVDDFKRVNDTMGHIFGDDVLCYVAKQILGVFRHTDVIARYGGDEFVVFAPSIQRDVLIERLNRLYNSFKYPYRNGSIEYNVSVTIGASLFPDDGADYDVLLEHADCALYEAKARGKARFVLYEPYMQSNSKSEQ